MQQASNNKDVTFSYIPAMTTNLLRLGLHYWTHLNGVLVIFIGKDVTNMREYCLITYWDQLSRAVFAYLFC